MTLGFWDLAYRDGDHLEYWEAPVVPPELVEAVESGLVGAGNAALDIGCGAGLEAVYLARLGVEVIGVDPSEVALDLAARAAEEAGVAVAWRLGRATALPVDSTSIDFALDRGCFHLIERHRRGDYAREVVRVLRPGGRLLLRGARADDEEAGLVGFDLRELAALFGPLGVTCESSRPIVLEARADSLEGWSAVLKLETA